MIKANGLAGGATKWLTESSGSIPGGGIFIWPKNSKKKNSEAHLFLKSLIRCGRRHMQNWSTELPSTRRQVAIASENGSTAYAQNTDHECIGIN